MKCFPALGSEAVAWYDGGATWTQRGTCPGYAFNYLHGTATETYGLGTTSSNSQVKNKDVPRP